jgi:manganese/zinc/iron transport system substrate-binding protein
MPSSQGQFSGRQLAVIVGIVVAACCINGCQAKPREKKLVVATTGMVADLARQVSGDTVELWQLMGAGVDPHLYKPKESAIRRLFQADLILYNGMHLEGKMDRLLSKNPRARAVARCIPKELLLEQDGQADPHVWFDVGMWIYCLDAVEYDLIELCPEHEGVYRTNAAKYRCTLYVLHEEITHVLGTIPEPRRVLVTAHDAFRYFGRAYLNREYESAVVGLQGVSTANQAGLRQVERVAELVAARGVKSLFVESSVPADGVKAVLDRCRARGHTVRLADQELFSDALGEPGTPEGSYVGMIWHNVQVIAASLK